MSDKPRIGISCGDLNGVGMELVLRILSDPRILHSMTPIVYAPQRAVGLYRRILGIQDWNLLTIETPQQAPARKACLINLSAEELEIVPGQPDPQLARFTRLSLERAVADLKSGALDALVTAPINKAGIQGDGFQVPGHTEFLQKEFPAGNAMMILLGDHMKVATVTGHIALKEVPTALTQARVSESIRRFARILTQDFAITRPKIAVLSLNPHAGDAGLLGDEEQKVIIPAIEAVQSEGILAWGPYGADGFFGTARYAHFDGVLGMYHDQVLTPFKALCFDSGVNFTAGLPVVRTSPDHGTAYELAGQKKADPSSFRSALYAAVDILRTRREQLALEAGALKPSTVLVAFILFFPYLCGLT